MQSKVTSQPGLLTASSAPSLGTTFFRDLALMEITTRSLNLELASELSRTEIFEICVSQPNPRHFESIVWGGTQAHVFEKVSR